MSGGRILYGIYCEKAEQAQRITDGEVLFPRKPWDELGSLERAVWDVVAEAFRNKMGPVL